MIISSYTYQLQRKDEAIIGLPSNPACDIDCSVREKYPDTVWQPILLHHKMRYLAEWLSISQRVSATLECTLEWGRQHAPCTIRSPVTLGIGQVEYTVLWN